MSIAPAIRSRGIGASEISAVVGLNPYMSAYDLWLSKTSRLHGFPWEQNERARWGKLLEKSIAQGFEEQTHKNIEWCDKTLTGKHPYQVYTPDAWLCDEPAGLDCKNIALDHSDKFGEEYTDAVPDYIALQCLWSCSASGMEKWYVAALFGGNTLKPYVVEADKDIEEH